MSCAVDQNPLTPVTAARPKLRLCGDAIAVPSEDPREIDRRFEVLEVEMAPRSELARQLVGRVGLLTLRLDRSAEQEAKAIAHRMRRAREEFDDTRLAEAEHLHSWIANEPATNARRLRRSLEGLDILIRSIEALRSSLVRPEGCRWDVPHCDQLLNMMGLRFSDAPVHRARALTEAMQGRFQDLDEADGAGLDTQRRREWALCRLVALIDAEIAKLKDLLTKFDREAIEFDREDAVARALFDHSKEAILARKYEAVTERGLYRALREFRDLQAETLVKPEVASDLSEKLGSSFPEPPAEPDESTKPDLTPVEVDRGRPEGGREEVCEPVTPQNPSISGPSRGS